MNIPDGITIRGCTPTKNENPSFWENKKFLEEKGNLIICDTDNCNKLVISGEEKAASNQMESSKENMETPSNTQKDVAKINRSDELARSYGYNRIVSNCYVCDTVQHNNCASNVPDDMFILCPLGRENFGCYHKINGEFH